MHSLHRYAYVCMYVCGLTRFRADRALTVYTARIMCAIFHSTRPECTLRCDLRIFIRFSGASLADARVQRNASAAYAAGWLGCRSPKKDARVTSASASLRQCTSSETWISSTTSILINPRPCARIFWKKNWTFVHNVRKKSENSNAIYVSQFFVIQTYVRVYNIYFNRVKFIWDLNSYWFFLEPILCSR